MSSINRDILEKEGWIVECESPYEISHTDGSFASGQAAYIVVNYILTLEDE